MINFERLNELIGNPKSAEELKIDANILFNAFKQSTAGLPLYLRPFGGGNCASIAIIKAAISVYGFQVFKSVVADTDNRRYLIDLRDEEERVYSVTYWAVEYAAERSGFLLHNDNQLSRDILLFANFCFSIMAEVKRSEFRIWASYKRAIIDLNRGEGAAGINTYLGLKIREVNHEDQLELNRTKAMLVWNSPHAVYASEGNYDEFFEGYNSIEPLTKLPVIHGSEANPEQIIGAHEIVR